MPNETTTETETETETESAAEPATEVAPEPKAPERFDEDGLPLDRAATIDDVRSSDGLHRRIAIGCFFVVVCLILAFWVLRGGLLG